MPADDRSTSTVVEPMPSISNVIVTPNIGGDGAPVDLEPEPGKDQTTAVGTDGEETIWQGHYSPKNFADKLLIGVALVGLWLYFTFRAWNHGESPWEFIAIIAGIAAACYGVYQSYRLIRANRGHHYRLTSRRLFFSSGFFSRRVDQVELSRVKDLFVQQSMLGSWLGVGTVYVISSEETLPRAALLGIDNPNGVMDTIWHHTRLEQERKKC